MDIRAARLAAGMSQSELARAAHVPQPNLSAYENGRRTPSPEVAERIARALQGRPSARLRQHRDEVLSVVAEYRASEPRVFGSVARGEDQAGSDLDLVVDFSDAATLLDEIGLRLALTDLLGVAVDVVAGDTLRGELRERVLREAVPV
jgi:predicted nucleotidyltransferase